MEMSNEQTDYSGFVRRLARVGRTRGKRRTFEQGEFLYQRGEAGDTMYVIVDGKVEIRFPDGRPSLELGPEDIFGLLALMIDRHQHTASAVAVSEVTAHSIDRASLDSFLTQEPEQGLELIRTSASYLVQSERRVVEELRARNSELERELAKLKG